MKSRKRLEEERTKAVKKIREAKATLREVFGQDYDFILTKIKQLEGCWSAIHRTNSIDTLIKMQERIEKLKKEIEQYCGG